MPPVVFRIWLAVAVLLLSGPSCRRPVPISLDQVAGVYVLSGLSKSDRADVMVLSVGGRYDRLTVCGARRWVMEGRWELAKLLPDGDPGVRFSEFPKLDDQMPCEGFDSEERGIAGWYLEASRDTVNIVISLDVGIAYKRVSRLQ